MPAAVNVLHNARYTDMRILAGGQMRGGWGRKAGGWDGILNSECVRGGGRFLPVTVNLYFAEDYY
jgi:hypothetical protein